MTLNYLKSNILAKILPLYATLNGRNYVMLLNLYPTSCVSVLLHGGISLPDATSYDEYYYILKMNKPKSSAFDSTKY